jgi:uncharacterized protein (TIGR03435 family)
MTHIRSIHLIDESRIGAAVVLCALMASAGVGQAPAVATTAPAAAAPKMEFDVASVKQNKSDDPQNANFPLGPGDVYVPNGGNFTATNLPLIVYIDFAYKVTANQAQAITKQLPGWVMTEKYNIAAKTDKHDATKDEMRLMMRSLLAERFKLAVHSETQQVPVFALVVAKPEELGPKLAAHPASEACANTPQEPAEDAKAAPSFTLASGFPVICGGILGMPPSTPGLLAMGARNISIGLIAGFLTGVGNLGKPVLDQTGLTGKYDFLLEFAPDRRPAPGDGANASAPLDSAGPGIEEALRQQLGLKLESTKGPVDVWVVDHVEHATEN